MIKRGEIYWAEIDSKTLHINKGRRPVLVVSNDKCNEFSPVVHCVPLTTAKKKFLPTHVAIEINGIYNTVLCEQIVPINSNELKEFDFIKKISNSKMDAVCVAMMKQLGIMGVWCMNVLSLFDGISCGMVALERAGILVKRYYASEIEKDVTKWHEWSIS